MKKTKKKNLVYNLLLNPGVIFIVLIMATGILIAIRKAGDKTPDMRVTGINTMDSSGIDAYTEDNGRGSTIPVSLKGKGILYSENNPDENNNLPVKDLFKDVTLESGIEFIHVQAGMMLNAISEVVGSGACTADYNNDGAMDIFSTYAQKNTNILYNNTLMESKWNGREYTSSKFVDATIDAGMGEDASVGYFGWGTGLFDYDNDGYSDIFVANDHGMLDFDNPRSTIGQRNQLFRKNRNGSFVEVSGIAGSGFKLMNSSRGRALGDYDNDGDIDIFVMNNNGYATLLKNVEGNANNWINIKLRGAGSNRDAVGARVRVVAGDLSQTKSSRSFCCII